jgi:hypothetical protein
VVSIHPFRIEIAQAELDDLHARLDRARWPDELPGVGWAYGVPRAYLEELARYWRYEYDWRAAESQLNQWPQFTATIDGANVHFAHVRSPELNATPVIMTHGWPGSIAEGELQLLSPDERRRTLASWERSQAWRRDRQGSPTSRRLDRIRWRTA